MHYFAVSETLLTEEIGPVLAFPAQFLTLCLYTSRGGEMFYPRHGARTRGAPLSVCVSLRSAGEAGLLTHIELREMKQTLIFSPVR